MYRVSLQLVDINSGAVPNQLFNSLDFLAYCASSWAALLPFLLMCLVIAI